MIFRNLEIEQVFILGLQSQHLWSVARRYLLTHYASSYGTWAGKSIICVGSYMESTDYPPNLLTESEKKELQEGLNEGESPDNDYEYSDDGADFVPEPINLYSLAGARYQPIEEWQSELGSRLISHAMNVGVWYGLSEFCKAQIRDELLRYRFSEFYPKDQPWILRNLTTQEYVRSEAIAIKPEYIHGPNIDVLGFGEVIFSRICWSTKANSDEFDAKLCRGPWAGHRFDITTLDRHNQGALKGAEWKDVSEEIADSVVKLWNEMYGSNWPEMKEKRL